jgi:hypothetical protein
MHKNDGGMGFKSLHAFNLAMLGKQGWRVMSNPDILSSKIYKAKYFPHCDFLILNWGIILVLFGGVFATPSLS